MRQREMHRKINLDEKGMTLVELLISLSLMSIVIMMTIGAFDFFGNIKQQLNAKMNSDQESLVWLGYLRKNFYVSLLDETAPPSLPYLEKINQNDGQSQLVKYVFNLLDKNDERQELFSITNRCVNLPEKMKNLVPKLTSSYIASTLNSLGANPGCVSHLSILDCGQGKSTVSELKLNKPNSKIQYYPVMFSSPGERRQIEENQIAGLVCVIKNAQNYLLVQMLSGTINQNDSGNNPVRWAIKKLVLPPSNNGNNQYIK